LHELKGVVHPKMKILLFMLFQNLHAFLSSTEHKKHILKNVGNQTVLVSIEWTKKETHGNSSQNIYRRKKAIQVWNDISEK